MHSKVKKRRSRKDLIEDEKNWKINDNGETIKPKFVEVIEYEDGFIMKVISYSTKNEISERF